MEPPTKDEKRIGWLNALIMLAQWNENLPSYVARLFNHPANYKAALQLFREYRRNGEVPAPPGTVLTVTEWELLYRKITSAATLRELFAGAADPFAGAAANEISWLADVSDLTTDAQTTFSSRNGTFHEVYEAVQQNPELNTKDQLNEGLHKFYMLFDADKAMAKELYKLACSDHWYLVLASLKDGRDYIPPVNEEARQLLKDWNSKLNTECRSILLKPHNLYRVPRKLVKVAWAKRGIFNEAVTSIGAQLPVEKFDRRRKVANVAYPIFAKRAKKQLDAIAADLQLLAVVARHYISVRRFAKLDGLVYAWRKIASVAMANYAGLKIVERFFIEKPAPPDSLLDTHDARTLFAMCQNDEALARFFRLQPYFKDIDENELRQYRPLAPVTADPTHTASQTTIPSPAPSPAVVPTPRVAATQSRVCELTLTDISAASDVAKPRMYEVSLKVANTEVAKSTTTFSVQRLLNQMLGAVGATPEETLQSVLKEFFAAKNGDQILFRAGVQLYKTVFGQTGLEQHLSNALGTDDPVRLVIATDEEEVHYLPWEWLPQPSSTELWLSHERYSLVRSRLTREDIVLPPLRLPLSMVGIFPNRPLGVRDLSESSINALTEVTSQGAQFSTVRGDSATLAEIAKRLSDVLPEVVHFEGFVIFENYSPLSPTDLLVLLSSETTTQPVSLDVFVTALTDADVQLLVVGKNEMGRVYGNAGPALANRLTQLSMPAVVAPMRAVDELTGNAFTTEFYRALLSGSSLEQALQSARRKVASGGGDWSSFALFANPSVLDFFQPLQPAA